MIDCIASVQVSHGCCCLPTKDSVIGPAPDRLNPPPKKTLQTKQVVQTLNPWAAVIPSNYSRVALPEFLGVNEGKMGAWSIDAMVIGFTIDGVRFTITDRSID